MIPCGNGKQLWTLSVPVVFPTLEPVSKGSILFEVKSKIPDFERGKAIPPWRD
jgi:hypothetical protein